METTIGGLRRELSDARDVDWRWIVARGIFGIIFGTLAFIYPTAVLATVALLFAFYVTFDGIMAISAAWKSRKQGGQWGILMVEGAFCIAAGILVAMVPVTAIFFLVVFMSAWALISGAMEIYAAFVSSKSRSSAILTGLAGVVSIAFGFLVIFRPLAGAAALLLLIATYSFFFGVFMTIWGFQLRQQSHRLPSERPRPMTLSSP